MILLHLVVYAAFLWLLTWPGNEFCRRMLKLSGVSARPQTPPNEPPPPPLQAGRVIGVLERTLILLGLAANSWEVMVAVIALKTVARYQELDKRIEAEYFLVGSLASILWAILVSLFALAYDRWIGFDLSGALLGLRGG